MMKLFVRCAPFLLLIGLLAACDTFDSDDEPEAGLRVYNGSPDAGRIDLVVDGDLKGFSIPFRRAIGYVRVPAEEEITVTVRREGDAGSVLAEETAVLEPEEQYTLYLLGPVGSLNPMLLHEQPVEDPGGTTGASRMRVLHGSTTAGTVDVYVVRVPVDAEEDFVPDLAAASPAYTGVTFGQVTSESSFDVSIEPGNSIGNSFVVAAVPSGSTSLDDALYQTQTNFGIGSSYLTLLVDAPDSTQQLATNAQILSGFSVVD